MTPEKLGPYRIERSIGRGGMGTVYAGSDATTGKPAAVKVLSPALSQDEGFRDRFDAEIRSLRSLDHPNIVSLIGFGEENGQLFYAMELIEGTSLAQELRKRGRFGWRQVVRIGIATARALKHAHDRGIIHRDLKPGNLLIDPDGHVKLSDFGIARVFGNNQLTSTGAVIGTAEYMAPEQADGRRVTLRCDLYSLGVVLYTLLAGRPPFVSNSMVEVLQRQRFEEPKPLEEVVGGIPRELAEIVAQLLQKNPEDRIPDAGVLARRLEALDRGLANQGEKNTSATAQLDAGPEATQADPRVAESLATEGSYDLAEDPGRTLGDASVADEPAESGFMPTLAATGTETAPPKSPETAGAKKPDGPGLLKTVVRLLSPGLWALVFGVLAVGLFAWYWSRPVSAEALYAGISEFIAENEADQWHRVENEIQHFLEEHPDDPRTSKLREILEEIELDRLEQRLVRGARRQSGRQDLGPIERAYLEAISLLETDPETAAEKLQAILDLYGPEAEDSDSVRLLSVVERRMAMLEQQFEQAAEATLADLKERLLRASELAGTDPEAARKIRQAVVELYHDKPWASQVVGQAESELASASAGSQ